MIAERLQRIKSGLPEDVTLVAVSKTKPSSMIAEAYAAGQRDFGENRPLEMRDKSFELPDDIRWHMIGHLQRNKVKYIIDFVHLIHAVDSVKLLEEIDKRAKEIGRKVDCLLQVHIAEETQKFGFETEELLELVSGDELARYEHVKVVGLMGMATYTDDERQLREEFSSLKHIHENILDLNQNIILETSILSMGMSGDYLIAIDEGSTMVRIGSSIFGKR